MNSFDEQAKAWDMNPVNLDRAEKIASAMAESRLFKSGLSALEYGCGTGLLSFALQPRLGSVDLADNSEGMLEVLRGKIEAAKISNMNAIRLDLTNDPLPQKSYGIIYTQMTLHHVKDTLGILRKFNALLEPQGLLYIADLDKEDGSFHGEGFDGHNGFEREKLTGIAKLAGFIDVEFESVYLLPKEVGGATKKFPIFLMQARKSQATI